MCVRYIFLHTLTVTAGRALLGVRWQTLCGATGNASANLRRRGRGRRNGRRGHTRTHARRGTTWYDDDGGGGVS